MLLFLLPLCRLLVRKPASERWGYLDEDAVAVVDFVLNCLRDPSLEGAFDSLHRFILIGHGDAFIAECFPFPRER